MGYDNLNMVENSGTYTNTGDSENTIKYWFDPGKYTEDLPREVVRSEVEKSLALWSRAARISFIEVRDEVEADVKISFETGEQGGTHTYGPGGAYVYLSGKSLNFDDEERFTADTSHGINLQYATSHAIGHILGIKHFTASFKNALMYPIYRGYNGQVELKEQDKTAAVELVGEGEGRVLPQVEVEDVLPTVTEMSESTTTVALDIPPECIEKIDAAFHWAGDQEFIYIFVGSWYYRLVRKSPETGNILPILDGTEPARRVGIDGYYGLPRNIDAASARPGMVF